VALRLFWPGMTQAEALAMIELVAASCCRRSES